MREEVGVAGGVSPVRINVLMSAIIENSLNSPALLRPAMNLSSMSYEIVNK